MVSIQWPPVQDLIANPTKYGSFFTQTGPDGYSPYTRLKQSMDTYGVAEANYNYGFIQNDFNRAISRAQNEVYNAMNNGSAKDPNSANTLSAKHYLDSLQGMVKGLDPSIVSGSVPSFEEMTGQPMKDPQSGQIVDAAGNIQNPPAASGSAQATNTSGEPVNSQGLTAEGMSSAAQGGGPVMVNGVDISHLSPTDQAIANAVGAHLTSLQASGQTVNPNVPITQDTIDGYLQQAKTELGPHFQQLLSQSQQDTKNNMSDISSAFGSKSRDISAAFGKNLENTQENMARHGLEFSSNRDQAEQNVATTANNQMTDAETKAMQDARDAGIRAERELGTGNLAGSTAGTLATGSRAVLGTPGNYKMSTPGSVRELYSPTGGTTGSLEYQENADVAKRATGLQNENERQLALGSTLA